MKTKIIHAWKSKHGHQLWRASEPKDPKIKTTAYANAAVVEKVFGGLMYISSRQSAAFDEVKNALLGMIQQHCSDYRIDPKKGGKQKFMGYDSMCLSANTEALEVAVKYGLIQKKEITR